jgi:hypothetical protein
VRSASRRKSVGFERVLVSSNSLWFMTPTPP